MRDGQVLIRQAMLRSLSLCLVVLTACPAPDREAERAKKKPRVEVVVLSTFDERFAEPAWAGRLEAAWTDEAARCVEPECALLKLSASSSATPSPDLGYVATSTDGGPTQEPLAEFFVERGGLRLQVLRVGGAGAESALQQVVPEVFKREARGTIVVSELCSDELAKMAERHGREWPFVLLAIGKPCQQPAARHIFATLVVAAGVGQGYVRSSLTFDRNTAALLKADSRVVELSPR
jgi:hypothetical protein